ncbi:MAG: DUF4893 domain-containing protein [Verrucomicrobiales bacterium]|nr:DUF4893 domain-containing protein [Verrucomicrobiales bacterium]MCP5558643.1 DUF4893 domain-containing protein [Verrucomicrobiaceae bacterium]
MNRRSTFRFWLPLLVAVNVSAAEPLRSVLKPEHAEALVGAEAGLKQAAQTHADSDQPDHVKVAKEVLALLALPRAEAPDASKLVGKWRVRSLQISDLGAYGYPFFDCVFRQEGATGIIFHKDSGSQRRMGIVGADSEKALLFVGASYYADEKTSAGYSALQEATVKTDPDRDSVGSLYQVGPGHCLLIFAPTRYGREIYELKKGK